VSAGRGYRAAAGLLLVLLGAFAMPGAALAHDDPILTVRVLCAGLTDGQVDAAMGEIDDNATVLVDRPLTGREQIQAWMVEQLAQNLRIEVVDIQTTQLADGYAVTWTTHMFREDWRKAGIAMRPTTEHATIRNGRITRWTSSLATDLAPGVTLPAVNDADVGGQPLASAGPLVGGVPIAEVPVTLWALAAILVLLGGGLALQLVQRVRHKRAADTTTRP